MLFIPVLLLSGPAAALTVFIAFVQALLLRFSFGVLRFITNTAASATLPANFPLSSLAFAILFLRSQKMPPA